MTSSNVSSRKRPVRLLAAFAACAVLAVAGKLMIGGQSEGSGPVTLADIESKVGIVNVNIRNDSGAELVKSGVKLGIHTALFGLTTGGYSFKDNRLTAWVNEEEGSNLFPANGKASVAVFDFTERGLICLSGQDTLDPKHFDCIPLQKLDEEDAMDIMRLGCAIGVLAENAVYAQNYCAAVQLMDMMEQKRKQNMVSAPIAPSVG